MRGLLHRLGLWRDPGQRARRDVAYQLYPEIVKQARTPALFGALGVPDTPEGRFESVAVHVAIVVRRLKRAGPPGHLLAQELFDLMFADMDHSLRMMGVGDLSVGKYVKRLARNFYARLDALDRGLDENDPAALRRMLEANVYDRASPTPSQIDRFIDYLNSLEADLAAQPDPDLLAGRITFAAIP